MKKTISLVLLVSLTLTAAVVAFAGCNLFKDIKVDEVKANLEKADYAVTVMTGEEYVQQEDADPFISSSELETYLHGVKGNEVMHLFVFKSVDTASRNSDSMTYAGLLSGQSNKVVYYATQQARSDAGL